MTSTIVGQFPTWSGLVRSQSFFPIPPNTSLADGFGLSSGWGGWSQGAQVIVTVPVTPTLEAPWVIYGWAITFSGFLVSVQTSPVASFGKLGKLYGGLIQAAENTVVTSGLLSTEPWQSPVAMPLDATLLDVMWDGFTDPAFPWLDRTTSTESPAAPIAFASQLPQPLQLLQGEAMSIGMWLTPSLCQGTLIAITNASYTIVYEEKPAESPTWAR